MFDDKFWCIDLDDTNSQIFPVNNNISVLMKIKRRRGFQKLKENVEKYNMKKNIFLSFVKGIQIYKNERYKKLRPMLKERFAMQGEKIPYSIKRWARDSL